MVPASDDGRELTTKLQSQEYLKKSMRTAGDLSRRRQPTNPRGIQKKGHTRPEQGKPQRDKRRSNSGESTLKSYSIYTVWSVPRGYGGTLSRGTGVRSQVPQMYGGTGTGIYILPSPTLPCVQYHMLCLLSLGMMPCPRWDLIL